MLAMDGGIITYQGAKGPLSKFLSHFGPTLLKRYQPKGIVVFSAHWETSSERIVTDYAEKPTLDGLLWISAGIVSTEIQIARR